MNQYFITMIEFLSQAWPWYVAGPLIGFSMLALLYFGESFGVSSNLRTLCTIGGAGRAADFFKFDWRKQIWNLVFVLGTIMGGYIAATLLSNNAPMELSTATIDNLKDLGFSYDNVGYLPNELFAISSTADLPKLIILIIGGLLVGFGTRYAGGCTSGHAISGLSNLQLPSLIAVVGFFIGGLIMTFIILPLIF